MRKTSSGIPYNIPKTAPSYVFTKGTCSIKVYYTAQSIDVYQTQDNHTQRLSLTHNAYENFENRLKSAGFTQSMSL